MPGTGVAGWHTGVLACVGIARGGWGVGLEVLPTGDGGGRQAEREGGEGGRTVERLLAAAGADVFRGRMTMTMTLAISDPSTGHDTGL